MLIRFPICTETKRRKPVTGYKSSPPDEEATGLNALATAAALNDDANPSASISATTTRHPRHRPGCTCIVCIQPPSGKGPKHKPSCTCNVCMTVKRRFRTLMLRKKIRQSEREAEAGAGPAQKPVWAAHPMDEGPSRSVPPPPDMPSEAGKGHIDLNCHPEREEDPNASGLGEAPLPPVSMMGLLQVAGLPLDNYLKQNGLTSLVTEQQGSGPSSPVVTPSPPESTDNEAHAPAAAAEEKFFGSSVGRETASSPSERD